MLRNNQGYRPACCSVHQAASPLSSCGLAAALQAYRAPARELMVRGQAVHQHSVSTHICMKIGCGLQVALGTVHLQ
jgi:hypothetical protein